MMKKNILITCLLLTGLLWFRGDRPVHAQTNPDQIIALVNAVRAKAGLPPFVFNYRLSVAAQQQADYMAANNIYSHTGPNDSSPQDRANSAGYGGRVTENIVGGTNMTAEAGVIWWQNSPVHYQTIVSPYFSEIGAAIAQGFGQNFYVIVVGSADGAPPAAQVPPEPIRVQPIELSSATADGSIIHKVLAGQALWTLAAYYGVEVDYLVRINNLVNSSIIQPGSDLYIRLPDGFPTPTIPPTPTPPSTHIVKAGQTLWSIAALYGITLDEILSWNGLTERSIVKPGDEVLVRLIEGYQPPPTATPPLSYQVQDGDTLWSIALAYGYTASELSLLNNFAEDVVLQVGQEVIIRLPDPTATPTVAPSETPAPTATPNLTPGVILVTAASTEVMVATPTPESAEVATLSPTATPLPPATSSFAANVTNQQLFGTFAMGLGLLIVGIILRVANRD